MTIHEGVMREELMKLSPEELYREYMEKQVNFGRAALAVVSPRRVGGWRAVRGRDGCRDSAVRSLS